MIDEDFDVDAHLSFLFIRVTHCDFDEEHNHSYHAEEDAAACKDIQKWLQALAALKVSIPPISPNTIGTHHAAVSLSALTQWV